MGSTKIKRILLINPFQVTSEGYNADTVKKGGQYAEYPLGFAYLKAIAKRDLGLDVEIFDANLEAIKHVRNTGRADMNELLAILEKKLIETKPDLVGVTCLFHATYKMAHLTCEVAKSAVPGCFVVVGGTYPTVSYLDAMQDENIDAAILSEGELSFIKLINCLNENSGLESVDGIAYRKGGKIIVNPKRNYIKDLDSLPWPDRGGSSIEDYTKYTRHFVTRFGNREKMKIMTLTSSRGCPFGCTFCSTRLYWGSRIRHRDPKKVVDEIEYLVKEHGATHIVFNDDNFNVNKNNASAILRGIIDRKLNIKWAAESGLCIAGLDKKIIAEMIESGITGFNIAIESGTEAILKQINKPVILDRAREVMKEIRAAGNAHITGLFMMGFPSETKQQIEDTFSFAKELDLEWTLFSRVQPYPGTEIYDYCKEHGLLIPGHGLEDLRYMTVNIRNDNFDEAYLSERAYLGNLELNFVDSRCFRGGDLEQGIRDFKWVIEMVPDHAIGYYSLGKAYRIKGQESQAKACFDMSRDIAAKDKKWKRYFEHFNISEAIS